MNKDNPFKVDLTKAAKDKIFYSLAMFPYPSGAGLHVGHALPYTANDIIARYKRMNGFSVLNPIGWDSFGLPTEGYAMKVGKPAVDVTKENIASFIEQCRLMDWSYDWDREFATSSPEYYKWTQWIFQQLFKAGLVYRKEAFVNWCPQDQTVLANDQVVDGKCERCGTEVVQKKHMQWFIKITDYAERLINDLDLVDWPEETKTQQKYWIGKSEGAEIQFSILNAQSSITVFTTRPDTIYGVTAIVLAPENELMDSLLSAEKKSELVEYRKVTGKKTALERQQDAQERSGFFSGVYAKHPLTNEQVPVWFADYVLPDYATGAVMCVPAHDERDWAFAKKHDLAVKDVIAMHYISGNPPVEGKQNSVRRNVLAMLYDEKMENVLCIDRKTQDRKSFVMGGVEEGEDIVAAGAREILEETGYSDVEFVEMIPGEIHAEYYVAHKDINRYSCENCAVYRLKSQDNTGEIEGADVHALVWVSVEEVDAFLSKTPGAANSNLVFFRRHRDANKAYTGTGKLINSDRFDGMDNVEAKKKITEYLEEQGVGRSKVTYKLRDWSVSRQRYWGSPIPVYYDEAGNPQLIPEDELPVLLPLDVKDYKPAGKSPLADHPTFPHYTAKDGKTYLRECDTLDTFMCSSFYFLRFIDPKNEKELISKELADKTLPVDFYIGGKEHTYGHLLYSRFIHKFLFDQGYVSCAEPFQKLVHQGFILGPDGRKMSKRWGNVINPSEVALEHGSDTLRTYVMFMGPIEQEKVWNVSSMMGVKKFLERVERLTQFLDTSSESTVLEPILHKTIKGVSEDIEKIKGNTAVSKLMVFVNEVYDKKTITKQQLSMFLQLLSPFATRVTQKIWEQIGNESTIHFSAWPQYDASKIAADSINLPVQINGKMKGTLEINAGTSQEEIMNLIQSDDRFASSLAGKEIAKIIFVQDKIINLIIK